MDFDVEKVLFVKGESGGRKLMTAVMTQLGAVVEGRFQAP